MSKTESSDHENENCSSEEEENASGQKLPEYEKQRLKRIEENNKRMEAMGLHKLATSFMGSVQKSHKEIKKKKGKTKMVDEDEEYDPIEDDDRVNSSSEDDEEFSASLKQKGKKKTSTPKKKVKDQKSLWDLDDEDEALMQAIALSLQDSAGFLELKRSATSGNSQTHSSDAVPAQTPVALGVDETGCQRKGRSCAQENSGKRKRKIPIANRMQMTADELLIHFLQFDDVGKGSITLKDIRRLAAAHDFTWSEKEISDMIYCLDCDGDGKLNFDDFRKIANRLNMVKEENGAIGKA